MLVVEDLQWADEATRDLLLLLARDLGLVLTYRREDLPAETPVLGAPYRRLPGTSSTEIHLDTLTEDDVHDLAAAVLGLRGSTAVGRALFERSAGLPLVVVEDLLTLTDRTRPASSRSGRTPGHSAPVDDVSVLEEPAVPRGLREAMTTRMAGLPEPAVAVVEAAAVLAVPVGQNLLTEVADLVPRQAGQALTEALQVAVLRETGPGHYAVRHALAQQAAYQHIPGPHRQAVRTAPGPDRPPHPRPGRHRRLAAPGRSRRRPGHRPRRRRHRHHPLPRHPRPPPPRTRPAHPLRPHTRPDHRQRRRPPPPPPPCATS